jgi:proline dehydrogenase
LNFRDTSIAFQHLSDAQLKRKQLLFRAMANPSLATLGPGLVTTAMRLRLPITPIIRHTIFSQFCGGETIDECLVTAGHLARSKVGTILDYAVEGKQQEADFDAAFQELSRAIQVASTHSHIRFAVFKLTGIARFELMERVSRGATLGPTEQKEWERVEMRVHDLCKAAFQRKLKVMIDAEETWIQPAIDQLIESSMRQFNRSSPVVHTTMQMYRADGMLRLEKAYSAAQSGQYHLGVKLVRGAYMEKERARAKAENKDSPIHITKKGTDHDYDLALRFCINHIEQVGLCAGTHNESSSHLLTQLMAEKGIATNDPRIEFSQLLGMSDNLTYHLAHRGYNVSKYVPYGPVSAVLPYLFRRAEENSAIKGQVSRELQLIETEIKRRSIS